MSAPLRSLHRVHPSQMLGAFLFIPLIYRFLLPDRSTSTLPASINMTSAFTPCPPIPQADGPVILILPPTEDRPHKYFTLPNGLEVIVVSDPKADKAAASMDVGIGHLSDPEDLPGCAHFWCVPLLQEGWS